MSLKSMLLGAFLIAVSPATSLAGNFECASFPDGDYQQVDIANEKIIHKDFLDSLHYTQGIASAKCNDNGLYFVAPEGSIVKAFQYDNGPDYFSEGLARIVDEDTNLVGYADRDLQIVIPAQFKTASPFNNSQALVSIETLAGKQLWGIINSKGSPIVSISHSSREEAINTQRSPSLQIK